MILKVLRESTIPISTPRLIELTTDIGYKHRRQHVWSVLQNLLRAGIVKKTVRQAEVEYLSGKTPGVNKVAFWELVR